jgi:hypothetical protein
MRVAGGLDDIWRAPKIVYYSVVALKTVRLLISVKLKPLASVASLMAAKYISIILKSAQCGLYG